MLFDFASALVFIVVGLGFVFVSLLFSRLVQTVHRTPGKLVNYECGENPEGSPWVKFNIRFYMVALGFIIFDVETIFLFPWAVAFKNLGLFAFIEMMIFVAILLVGLAYIWSKGDIEWVKPRPAWLSPDASSPPSEPNPPLQPPATRGRVEEVSHVG
jgi:NADH-quinone oxidoreductase subunit A